MKHANQPLLQVCFAFVLGVWLGFIDFDVSLSTYWFTSLVIFLVLILTLLLAPSKSVAKPVYAFVALLFIFSLGLLNTKIHFPQFQPDHFSQVLSPEAFKKDYVFFEGKITKPLKSNAYKDKYKLSLSTLDGERVDGHALLQVAPSDTVKLTSNARVTGVGSIKAFQNPANPQQFNYKTYMANLHMSHVINAEESHIRVANSQGYSLQQYGDILRQKIKISLQKQEFTSEQMELIQALLLGQKQEIDPETYAQFSKAGVVHILAVSGLHVGIILLILQSITKVLLRFKHGKLLRSILVFVGIWSFAALAGFSTSVLRAAVMFSLLSIALNNRRKTSAINTLAISALLLLLYNPYFINQVGFQLSYLAVISIVVLQPRLSKLYRPKFIWDKKIWDIITVTLAAQLGVMPLSLYYFHQFPGLFLISNLVILPVLGLLLGGGILVILLSLANMLPDFLVIAYAKILDVLLQFVSWVASKEELVFSDIYYTQPMLIFSLLLLLALLAWNKKRKQVSYSLLNVSLLALMICIYIEKRKQLQQKEIVIFQTYQTSQMAMLEGSLLNLFTDQKQDLDTLWNLYHLKNYKSLKGVQTLKTQHFKATYRLSSGANLLILDSVPAYPKSAFSADYLLLKNSPDINLDMVIIDLQPKQIIADGSNYKTDVDRWRVSAENASLLFHSTWENGAFIIDMD